MKNQKASKTLALAQEREERAQAKKHREEPTLKQVLVKYDTLEEFQHLLKK